MSELLYKYNPGDRVWARQGNKIKECIVCRASFEVDPTSTGGITEEKTYHLDIVGDKNAKIILRPESEVYETPLDAIEENSPTILNYSHFYEFDVEDIVWSYTGSYVDFEAAVKQITINLTREEVITPVSYNMTTGYSSDASASTPWWNKHRGGPTVEFSMDYSITGEVAGSRIADETQTTNPYLNSAAFQSAISGGVAYSTPYAFRIWIKKQDDYNTLEAGVPAPDKYKQTVAYLDYGYGTGQGLVATFVKIDTVTGEIVGIYDNNYAPTIKNVKFFDGEEYGHPDWWILTADSVLQTSAGWVYMYPTDTQADLEDFFILGNIEAWMNIDSKSIMDCYPNPVYNVGIPLEDPVECASDTRVDSETLYHILATNGEYHTLIHDSNIVFATQQEALDAIAAIITPTPTISVTATVTPTVTPDITPTITPTIAPSQTVTPNPTVTPTQSG